MRINNINRIDSAMVLVIFLGLIFASSCKKDDLPVDEIPNGEIPVDTMQIDTMILDTMMVDTMWMDTIQIDTMSVDTMTVDTMQIDTMPIFNLGYQDTTMMIDVGGYHLYAETKGSGPVTIVFENGLGDHLDVWKEGVFQGISSDYQLVIYNRAGYAPSEFSNNSISRNINQIAIELKTVIDSLAQNETVILVGHSLGGPIIRSFVNQFPDKVEAMLFVDPAHEWDYTESSIVEFQEHVLNNEIPDVPQTQFIRQEIEALIENWAIQNTLPLLPNIPVTVLTAMSLVEPDGDINTAEERQIWYEMHASLGEGVDDFTHLSSDQVSHQIHEEDPDMVIDAVMGLID